jgi:hypothetical protein
MFAPNGTDLITTHDDHTTRTWPCEICGPITNVLALATTRTTRQLTTGERRVYLND